LVTIPDLPSHGQVFSTSSIMELMRAMRELAPLLYGLDLRAASWLPNTNDFQRATRSAFKRRNASFDFNDGVAYGFEAKPAIGLRENLAFDDTGIVTERDKLHQIARDLMVRTVGDDQTTDGNALAGIAIKVDDLAIRVPRDIGKLFKRMAGDGKSEQFSFIPEPLIEVGLR
jgi:hypothetical protein